MANLAVFDAAISKMTEMVPSQGEIESGCAHLASLDAALFKAYAVNGPPEWRTNVPGFRSLARIIVFQLLSTQVANMIWKRLCDGIEGGVSAEAFAVTSPATIQAIGLTKTKARCLHNLACAIVEDGLDLSFHGCLDAAQARLTELYGIGPWTANIYRMTALGDIDAFPMSDVGLMEAYKLLRGDDERLSAQAFNARADNWSPYRGVAAHLLWAWINASRRLPPDS